MQIWWSRRRAATVGMCAKGALPLSNPKKRTFYRIDNASEPTEVDAHVDSCDTEDLTLSLHRHKADYRYEQRAITLEISDTSTMALTKTLAATDDEIARDLLVKNNWELTPVETLVDVLGFTEVEKRMQKLFWDPAFRSAHIYLSDELIKDHLTDETGECAIRNFVARTLLKHFVKDRDYVEVTKDHELVHAHFYRSPENGKNLKPPSHRKRHFVVTSKCFKSMLMMSSSAKGITTRGYYIKIEDMARIVTLQVNMRREHVFEIESKNNELKLLESSAREAEAQQREVRAIEEKAQAEAALARQREEHEKQTQQLTAQNARLQQLAIQIQNRRSASDPLNKTEVVYIDSTRAYAMQGIFKIGRTKDSKTRLVGLNTSHVAEDELEHVRIIKTHNARLLEAFLHMYFKSCHHDREWYRVPYEVLMAELDQIELHFENLRQANLAFMAATDTRYRTQLIDEIDWARGLNMNIFKIAPAQPRAAVADGARLIVLDPQQAINAIPPADREAVLKLASAYVNTTYKNINPPCEHTTARADGHRFPIHIPDFREWGSSALKVPAVNLVQWNDHLHDILTTHHKQIRPFLRRPTNWRVMLKDNV